ncbi:type II/IV secretion system protein [Candidatus Pacebacteria bacterium]|nr:type II/IV secretion system protein [Candidatus Paceibacterota bacterium]
MQQFDDTYGVDKMNELRAKEEDRLIRSLSTQYGIPYVDLRGVTINPTAILTIKEEAARSSNCVAFELQNKKLSVAIRNPNNAKTKETLADLEKKGFVLNIFMTSSINLEHGWKRYKDSEHTTSVKKGVLDINLDIIAELLKKFTKVEEVNAHILEIRTINSARRVSETLEAMFAGAIALHASDIHIEPEETGIRIRYRLDGVLYDVLDMERTIYERLISRLKLLSGVMLNVHDQAQEGRFTFDVGEKRIEIRSSVIPDSSGESIVMRLLDPSVASFSMENLGLNSIVYNIMIEELKKPNGMIITTGPTGSGKTSALYAFLQKAHNDEVKIITLEDPVEYKLDGVVQTQISDGYTFSSGLRSILRQDPDIIMVGEIRDREVAETAVRATQTGHLVFSTLHTNSAAGAIPRLIDLGVDPRAIGTSFNIILGQRLVRKLCEQCKQKRKPTAEEVVIIEKIIEGHPHPPTFSADSSIYDTGACEACNHSGFKGRQSIVEAVKIDEAVEEAIIRDPREHIILEAARPQGIPTMAEDGIDKVLAGITSILELRRVVDLSNIRGTAPKPDEEEIDTEFASHIV